MPTTLEASPAEINSRLELLRKDAGPAAQQLIDTYTGQPPLGSGDYKVVYAVNENTVISFLSPQEGRVQDPEYRSLIDDRVSIIKRRFYFQKIAHLLMPDHVPDIHMADSEPGMQITDRVFPAAPSKNLSLFDLMRRRISKRKFLRRVNELELLRDHREDNIIYDDLNNAHYVDDFQYLSLRGIERGIQKMNEADQARATRWLHRMSELKA